MYQEVQLARVFPDGKTFADCTPKSNPKEVLEAYHAQKDAEGFNLRTFVLENFELPTTHSSNFKSDTSRSVEEHIEALWAVLERAADVQQPGSSLIPLPKSYIVPGGRFGEIYYWDSYFTMLGLQESKRYDIIENMVDNFAYLIDKFGFIPNGNRTYFLGRSQPPFYADMVNLLAEGGNKKVEDYLPQLEKEYAFWMEGVDDLSPDHRIYRRVVRLEDGTILNRYWDNRNDPRQEMYADDVELQEETQRDADQLYRDIRSACESGWDFSSRWFRDGKTLGTIHTTEIAPVCLNALLYNLEITLIQCYEKQGQTIKADAIKRTAEARKAAIQNIFWSESEGYFMDYDFVAKKHTPVPSLVGMYPLTFNMASDDQAKAAGQYLAANFLKPGGLVSTLNETGQQWDYPNAWAPLQWMSIKGLRNYGQTELANDIKFRWIQLGTKVYENTGKMVEKYNVIDMNLEAGGGEYPLQDGFGWSNGVLLKLIKEQE